MTFRRWAPLGRFCQFVVEASAVQSSILGQRGASVSGMISRAAETIIELSEIGIASLNRSAGQSRSGTSMATPIRGLHTLHASLALDVTWITRWNISGIHCLPKKTSTG